MSRCLLLACLAGVGLVGPAAAQSPLDRIPPDAVGAFIFRNVKELEKKGDRLLEETKMPGEIRLSQMIAVLGFLGIPMNQLDLTQPVGIVVGNPALVDKQKPATEVLDKAIVLALPIKSQEEIEKAFKLEAGILKGGPVVKLPQALGGVPIGLDLITLQGKHVFIGSHEKVLQQVSRSKGIAGELPEAQRKALASADAVLHLGTKPWGDLWKEIIRDLGRNLEQGADESDKKLAQNLAEALQEVRFGLASLRIEDGIGISLLSVFPKEGSEAARKLLTVLRAGEGASSLKGLPEGNVLAATAARGDGTQNAGLAQLFLRLLFQEVLVPQKVLGAADRPVLLTVFNEVWQRLRGSRLALYRTADASELGLFSMVGILDTEDPQKFLEELKQLARLGGADGLDFKTEQGKKASEVEIENLIKDLGNRRFQVRNSAEVRLLLIGEPVLPYLEKATRAADLETRRRAERIRLEIISLAEQARKDLLSGRITQMIRPSFSFLDKSEKVSGVETQVVAVKLPKKDAPIVPQLKALLGPDWNRIRFAVQGKQVIVLVGSDLGLLQKAIRNVKEDSPGLAGSKLLQGQSKLTDAKRKIEMHFSTQMAAALAAAKDLEKPLKIPPATAMTSLTLSVEADRIQLDFWMPTPEIRAMVEANKQPGQ